MAVILCGGLQCSAMEKLPEIVTPSLTVRALTPTQIRIETADGKKIVDYNGIRLKGTLSAKTVDGGSVRRTVNADGLPTLEVRYAVSVDGDEKTKPVVVGRFTPNKDSVRVTYDITGVPTDKKFTLGNSMLQRSYVSGTELLVEQRSMLTHWERHEAGGIPYEVNDGTVVPYRSPSGAFAVVVDGHPNLKWRDGHQEHISINRVEPGHFKSEFAVVLADIEKVGAPAIGGIWRNCPVGLTLRTDRAFHCWQSAKEPLCFTADINSSLAVTQRVERAYWVRDFAGRVIAQDTRQINLPPLTLYSEPLKVQTSDTRGIYFVEVSLKDLRGHELAFARINLTVLPPHTFSSTPQDSIFGLAAYWPLPSEEVVQDLMDRMGVRWLREGDTRKQHPPRIANHHSNTSFGKEWNPTERDAWIRKQFEICVENKNPCWEFGNEINMSTFGIALEGGGIGKALLAPQYIDWINAVRRVQKEKPEWQQIQLLSFGVAGMDTVFVRKLIDAGTFAQLDGLCLHPGRGNFAPDYPLAQPWLPHDLKRDKGSFWNYYGAVRTAHDICSSNGSKPLWLTEVYAPTNPNSHWEDTPRHAAENVLLSFILAKVESVKAVMYYQLFDSVWYDRLGVNHKEREYFFGLIHRDYSLKPALLAYCAAAEHLESAVFKGWVKFDGTEVRGVVFDTPRGALTILWNRADGYILTEKVKPFATPEPWVDLWKTKTAVTLPTSASSVRIINAIGQHSTVASNNKTVTLKIDGAPTMIYGLDIAQFKLLPNGAVAVKH